ncbi:MAG: hypothetical protein N3F63_05600 [Thermoplasmata archaeon]|nr:hypothetical protein [Thermoplasmata archaeon]
MSVGSMGVDIYFVLITLILFFGFFVSPFFSAFAGAGQGRNTESPGIMGVFMRNVRRRKEALFVWGILALADAVLATVFLQMLPAIPLPLAFLCVGAIIFIYVVEIHGINKMFGRGDVENGN